MQICVEEAELGGQQVFFFSSPSLSRGKVDLILSIPPFGGKNERYPETILREEGFWEE